MDTGDTRQSAFNASRFRDAIGFAMQMGIPSTVSERITFQWSTDNTYTIADAKGAPYDWTAAPASSVSATDIAASLTVPVTSEFFDSRSASSDTPIGDFDKSRLKIFMLDASYDQLIDQNMGLPDKIITDGNTYDIEYWTPPTALFDVTTYTAYAAARDES